LSDPAPVPGVGDSPTGFPERARGEGELLDRTPPKGVGGNHREQGARREIDRCERGAALKCPRSDGLEGRSKVDQREPSTGLECEGVDVAEGAPQADRSECGAAVERTGVDDGDGAAAQVDSRERHAPRERAYVDGIESGRAAHVDRRELFATLETPEGDVREGTAGGQIRAMVLGCMRHPRGAVAWGAVARGAVGGWAVHVGRLQVTVRRRGGAEVVDGVCVELAAPWTPLRSLRVCGELAAVCVELAAVVRVELAAPWTPLRSLRLCALSSLRPGLCCGQRGCGVW